MNITDYLSGIGRRGGKSKSEAKRRAAAANAKKATEARRSKKNLAANPQCSQANGGPV